MSTTNQELRLLIKNELEYITFQNPKSKHFRGNIFKKYKHIIGFSEKLSDIENLYCYINNVKPNTCYCGNPTKFTGYLLGYSTHCSNACANKHTGDRRRFRPIKKTRSREEIVEESKIKKHNEMINKYGEKYTELTTKEKREITLLKNYGVTNPNYIKGMKEKKKERSILNWGTEHPHQTEKIKKQKAETNLKKFGFEHATQNPEIFVKQQKNLYRYKKYILPSGKEILVQGYENYALDILLQTYDESQLLTDVIDMPEIWYEYKDTNHRYYCDIFIPYENKLIEAKSTYTYNGTDEIEEINLLKQKASRDLGYNHEIWIIDKERLINVLSLTCI